MPGTLHALVEAAAERFPDRPAVISPEGQLCYRELEHQARGWAEALCAAGVKPGDRVGHYQPKSPRGVAQILGALKCGAAYVPVDPNAPPDRALFVFDHAQVSAVFSEGRPRGLLEARLLELDRALPLLSASDPEPSEARRPEVSPDALAYILYTSGSTGAPKGVAITHRQSLAFVNGATPTFELREDDVLASHAPFNFDLSVIDLYCAFSAGAAVSLIPEKWLSFPAKVAAWIEESGITVWNSVPSALVQLVARGALEKRNLEKLRLIMFAGEPYPVKQLRRLVEAFPKATVMNVYGQTEANSSTYYVACSLPEDDAAVLPIGQTFPGYGVLVLSDEGREITEPGPEGELYVRGEAVASGYHRDPERTRKAFVAHPLDAGSKEIVYKTGDRVAFDAEGNLVFRGRQDAAVKVRGFRVELQELEAQAVSVPAVEEAAAVARPHDAEGHELYLFVSSAAEPAALCAEIEARLSAKLPPYMRPKSVRVQSAPLPKTGTGKIDKKALERQLDSGGVSTASNGS